MEFQVISRSSWLPSEGRNTALFIDTNYIEMMSMNHTH